MRFIIAVSTFVMMLGLFVTNVSADAPVLVTPKVLKKATATRFVTASLSVETPVGMAPQHASENSTDLLLSAKLHNVFPHLNLFAGGKYNFRTGAPFNSENKYKVGLEYELVSGITVFSYYERRVNSDQNRYMVGATYSYKSSKF